MRKTQWSLGAKLAMLGTPFLVLVVISTTAMLWMSWQLDGGAAAVNEAGRMRMQAYRMALSANLGAQDDLPDQIDTFGRSATIVGSQSALSSSSACPSLPRTISTAQACGSEYFEAKKFGGCGLLITDAKRYVAISMRATSRA